MTFFSSMAENRREAADKDDKRKLDAINETIEGNHLSYREKLARIVDILELHRDTWPMIGFKTVLGLILLMMVFYLVSHERPQVPIYVITWMTLLAIAAGLLSSCISGMLTFKTPLIKASGPLAFSGVLLYLMVVHCDTERQETAPESNDIVGAVIDFFSIQEAHAQTRPPDAPRKPECDLDNNEYDTRIYYPVGIDYLKRQAFKLKKSWHPQNAAVYSSGSFLKAIFNNLFVEDGQYELIVRYNDLIDKEKIRNVVCYLEGLHLDHATTIQTKPEIATSAHLEIYLWPAGLEKPF